MSLTVSQDAPPDKIQREFGKYPEQMKYGLRIVGFRIYDPSHPQADETGYRFFQKEYGRSLTKSSQLAEAFRVFLSAGLLTESDNKDDQSYADERIRTRVANNILVLLRQLRRWFDENDCLRFYASSLLIVYDGDTSRDVGNRDVVTLKMIDFGRVRRESGGDPGYITGLRTLRNILTQLVEEDKQTTSA